MTTAIDRHGRPGGDPAIGRRPYYATPSDLKPYPSVCRHCAGPRMMVRLDIPDHERGGSALQGPAKTEAIAGFLKYLDPSRPCPACEQLGAIATLMPVRATRPAIMSPEAEELAALKAALAPTAPVPGWEPPSGALFGPGTLFVTAAAAQAVGRCDSGFKGNPFQTDLTEMVGREQLGVILGRFVAGDLGPAGRVVDGDPEIGSTMGPLSSPVDQAAAAVRDGRGTVRASYTLERIERRRDPDWGGFKAPEVVERPIVLAWCELLPGGSRTLICTDTEAGAINT